MRLSERSYPYPVIGNRDDVPVASFQATMIVSFDAETAFIDVTVANSSRTLNALIGAGRASYVVHVECSNTLYRVLHRFSELEFRVSIPKNVLNSTVEINVVAIATENIDRYVVDGQHEEYGLHHFAINKGDILAIYPGQQFTVDRDYMTFQNIDSIVTVVPMADSVDRPMAVMCDSDKITVLLSKADFNEYSLVRNSALAPILASTIVLPVITEAIRVLRDSHDIDPELRWCRAITKRIAELGKSTDEEPLLLAQTLLELPIKRALSAAVSAQSSD